MTKHSCHSLATHREARGKGGSTVAQGQRSSHSDLSPLGSEAAESESAEPSDYRIPAAGPTAGGPTAASPTEECIVRRTQCCRLSHWVKLEALIVKSIALKTFGLEKHRIHALVREFRAF